MILCLSSGSRPRYRDDILEGLAMPSGAAVRLRYRPEWVAEDLRDAIRVGCVCSTPLDGWSVLYCYVDQSRRGVVPEIVPLRYGKILSAEDLGPALSLRVEMGNIVGDHDLGEFNERLRATADRLPEWVDNGRPRLEGLYCLRYPLPLHRPPESGAPSSRDGLRAWESKIRVLAGRPDFAKRRVYYVVRGVDGGWLGGPARIREGEVRFGPARSYTIRVYHFDPSHRGTIPPHPSLQVRSSSDEIRIVTPPLIADSAYDLKSIRLRTGRPAVRDEGVLVVVASNVEEAQPARPQPRTARLREPASPKESREPIRAFELPVRVRSSLGGKVAAASFIGIALAAQALLVLREEFEVVSAIVDRYGAVGVFAVVMAASFAIGATVAFGLKRTV